MCLSGDIETTEYKKACERLNSEHAELLDKLKKEKENRDLLNDKTEVIDAVTNFVKALSVGEEWDDVFYRNIVDKIYVHKDRTIDVHLKLIPKKLQAKILKGKSEIKRFEENQNFLPKGGASVPSGIDGAFAAASLRSRTVVFIMSTLITRAALSILTAVQPKSLTRHLKFVPG